MAMKPNLGVTWCLFILTFPMASSNVQKLPQANTEEGRAGPMNQNAKCKMTLFSGENYTGVDKVMSWSMSSIEFEERSLVTEGPCCWKIYP